MEYSYYYSILSSVPYVACLSYIPVTITTNPANMSYCLHRRSLSPSLFAHPLVAFTSSVTSLSETSLPLPFQIIMLGVADSAHSMPGLMSVVFFAFPYK